MEHHLSYSRHKLRSLILIPATIMLLLGTASCSALELFNTTPPPTRAPEQFPDTEIVFDAGNRIGFVNPDGSALTYITMWAQGGNQDYESRTLPVMTGDNSTLVFLLTRTTKLHEPYVADNPYVGGSGQLVVVEHGELPVVCEIWSSGKPQLLENGLLVLNSVDKTFALYNPAGCVNSISALPLKFFDPPLWQYTADNGQIKTVPQFGYISPNGQLMAYKLEETVIRNSLTYGIWKIAIRDLSSGDETVIGEGDYPAWSRDSQWLSYVGDDGIYVVRADGSEKRRVVESTYSNSMIDYSSGYYIPPWPSWSPDGQWLVYHLCLKDRTSNIPEEIPIYKVNINTGEVIKIVDYGIFPSWRWPAQP